MVTLALIGCGKWGKNYLNTIYSIPELERNVRIKTIITNKKKIDHAFINWSNNLNHVLDDPEIDGAIVAVPTEYNYDICSALLKSGKHILCEKPVDVNSEKVFDLYALAELNNRSFYVDYIHLYNPDYINARLLQLLQKPSRIYSKIYGNVIRPNISPFFDYGIHQFALLNNVIPINFNQPTYVKKQINNHDYSIEFIYGYCTKVNFVFSAWNDKKLFNFTINGIAYVDSRTHNVLKNVIYDFITGVASGKKRNDLKDTYHITKFMEQIYGN